MEMLSNKWTNKLTALHQFQKEPAMIVIYLPVKFEFDWTNRFQDRVREQKCGWTDGWTNGQKMDKRSDGITPISKGT